MASVSAVAACTLITWLNACTLITWLHAVAGDHTAYHVHDGTPCGTFNFSHQKFPSRCKDDCKCFDRFDWDKCDCYECLETQFKEDSKGTWFVDFDCEGWMTETCFGREMDIALIIIGSIVGLGIIIAVPIYLFILFKARKQSQRRDQHNMQMTPMAAGGPRPQPYVAQYPGYVPPPRSTFW